MRFAKLLALLVIIPVAAFAGPAEELSGLFLQSCLPYAGDPAALRQWATALKLPDVPDPARAAFLGGASGKVFDASDPAGKFVLVSSDGGLCSVITDKAADQDVVQGLEHALTAAGVVFRLVAERNDPANPKLHHREYLATRHGRSWRILAETVRDNAGGQAMLTAGPQ
jgi:hypothetical protein